MTSQFLNFSFNVRIPDIHFEVKTTTDNSLVLLGVGDIPHSFLMTLKNSDRSSKSFHISFARLISLAHLLLALLAFSLSRFAPTARVP
jgi:hypothetical protein